MSQSLLDAVARIARHEAQAKAIAALAVVTQVHARRGQDDDHAVTVRLRDQGLLLDRVPIAVGALGFVATPAVGDLVLVVFADGDLHAPVVVGSLYHRDLAPPPHDPGQVVLALPPGQEQPKIHLVLDGEAGEISLAVGDKTTVSITGTALTVTCGDAEIKLDGSSPEELTVKIGEAKAVLSAKGDVTFEAGNKLTLKASQLELEGSATVKITGAKVDIN